MKKIERLDYNTSVYPPHIPRLQTVIEKVQELIDAHNELLETHTVKGCCDYCIGGGDHLHCPCHKKKEEFERDVLGQPTTPEKKCCDKDTICNKCAIQTSSYEVTCGRCEKSIKHSC